MDDNTKHVIANAIYKVFLFLKRELMFVWKPILLGIIIAAVFSTIAEWSDVLFGNNQKGFWGALAIIGFFLPSIILYYKRMKRWVLKWK